MVPLTIDLCGPFAATSGGQPAPGLTSAKMQALLAFLAVEDDRPHARAVLATLLWPEHGESAGRQNLRQTLSRLRRALGEDLLRVSRSEVAWETRDAVDVDYWVLRAASRRVARHAHAAPAACASCCAAMSAAVERVNGEFLAGLEPDSLPLEEWLLLQREWLRREVLSFHHHLVDHHEQRGRLEVALTHAWTQIALDPLRETAHQQLMRLLARTGRFSDALTHYESLVARLDDELGVAPAAETAELVARIRRGDFAPAPVAPAVHLPATFTPLVGRAAELAEIGRLLGAGCRLLTLSGPGGVGKTRLALAAAAALASGYQDGVYFADLTDVTAVGGAVDVIGAALGLSFAADGDAAGRRQAILDAFAPRRALLLLDNYEQLLPDVDLPVALLAQAPQLDLLITSRAPLALRAESVLPLDGLAAIEEDSADQPAVALFTTAARRAQAGFTPDAAARRAIATIARTVAGLPLGLELAAALVRLYPVTVIARELAKSLDFAATAMPDMPARHRSLRAVYDHSVSLLGAPAQAALRRLSIFAAPFSYEAAEALLNGDAPALRRLQEFELVGNTEQGLLRLHPLLQQFAREALAAAGETEATAAAHAVYIAGWLAAARAAQQPEEMAHFLRAGPDVVQAWRWAVAAGRDELLLQMLPSLQRNYLYSGYSDIGLALVEAAVADRPTANQRLRRALLLSSGRFAYRRGLYRRSEAAIRAGLALGDDAPPPALVMGEMMLGHVLSKMGDDDEALVVLHSALARAQAAGLTSNEGDVRRIMGNIFLERGDLQSARDAYQRALPMTDETHPRGRAATLGNLGSVYTGLGDFAAARRFVLEALAVHKAQGDVVSEVISHCDLAQLEMAQGAFRDAGDHLLAARAALPPEGTAHVAADVQFIEGELALARAEYAVVAGLLPQLTAVYERVGEALGRSATHVLEARLLLSLGLYEQAEQLLRNVRQSLSARRGVGRRAESEIWLSRLLTESERAAEGAELAATALASATHGDRLPQAAAAQTALALALEAQGELDAARAAGRAALTQRRLLGQPHLAAAPLALLIRLALAGVDGVPAAGQVAELDGILEQWRGNGLLRFADVYLAAVDGTLALGDSSAAQRLLTAGQMRLAVAAEALDRPAWRHALTTRVAANRALLAREIG